MSATPPPRSSWSTAKRSSARDGRRPAAVRERLTRCAAPPRCSDGSSGRPGGPPTRPGSPRSGRSKPRSLPSPTSRHQTAACACWPRASPPPAAPAPSSARPFSSRSNQRRRDPSSPWCRGSCGTTRPPPGCGRCKRPVPRSAPSSLRATRACWSPTASPPRFRSSIKSTPPRRRAASYSPSKCSQWDTRCACSVTRSRSPPPSAWASGRRAKRPGSAAGWPTTPTPSWACCLPGQRTRPRICQRMSHGCRPPTAAA